MGHTHRCQLPFKKKNQVRSPNHKSRVPETGSDPPIGSGRESRRDIHYSYVFTIHSYSLFILIHYSFFTMHCALCTMHCALCTMDYALLCTMHYAFIRIHIYLLLYTYSYVFTISHGNSVKSCDFGTHA